MMVVAEAPVVKVASEPVLIIATPVVYSGPNEEYTEGCHSSDGTILTLPIFSSIYSTKLELLHP